MSANLTTRLDNMPYKPWHFGLTGLTGSSVFFDSYDVVIMSAALPVLAGLWGLDSVQTGYLGSAGFAGMVIGALLGGTLADKIGRAKTFCLFTAIYSIFMAFSATSSSFGELFIWRVIIGIGLGGLIPIATSYLSEFIPSRVRGRSLSVLNAIFGMGAAFAYLMGFMVVVPIAWSYGFLIGAIPIIIAILGWFFMPESIRFNLSKGKIEVAAKQVDRIERKLTGKVTVPLEEAIRIEEEEAKNRPVVTKVAIAELFHKDVRGTTILLSVMWFCLSYGTFGMTTWLPTLLVSELGYNIGSGMLWLAIATAIAAVIAPSAGVMADTIGRKKTILIVYCLFAVSALLLFIYGGVAGMFLMVLLSTSMNMCNAVNYVFVPESFPTRVRATGVGFASACGRVGAMVGPTLIGILISVASVQAVLYVNMAVLVFAALIVMIFGKETKNKSLEAIEMSKEDKKKE